MRMMRILLGALALAALAAPAAQASQVRHTVTQASGYERVYFSGTPAAGCAAAGTCGVSGTVVYGFGGKVPRGRATVSLEGNRVTGVAARFVTIGKTSSTVTLPGSGSPCTDDVDHRGDGFVLGKASGGLLDFALHTGAPDYLATRCPGPGEAELVKAGALPSGLFKGDGFRSLRFRFGLNGSQNFAGAGGYEGTASWKLRYKLGAPAAKSGG